MAADRGLRVEVVVGEEITTLGGHLLASTSTGPIRPYRSLRTSILAVHEAGGLAIPAHPLVPYPLCAQGWVLRRLLDDPDPAAHPDALETFNPTSARQALAPPRGPLRGRARSGPRRQQRRARPRGDRHGLDPVPGPRRRGPAAGDRDAGTTQHGGSFHETAGQLGTFGRQLRKRGRDARDEVAGRVRRDGTGRDHGYPGGRHRPPRFETPEVGERGAP